MRTEENRKIALDFFKLAFEAKKPKEAAQLFLGEPYIQHNPYAEDGRESFVRLFSDFFESYPESTVTIHRVIAEGDFVAMHIHAKKFPNDLGQAVAEFFRIKDRKIVEHWDVLQDVAETAKNLNPMF